VDAFSVAVERGGIVESVHRVHAVLSRDGRVEAAWGDAALPTFVRSAAKPFQALSLARDAPELPSEELAIACASHEALAPQLAAVEALLARAGASEHDLECGLVDGRRLRHNCSGKHAGMLLRCRLNGWPTAGYRLAGHPLQQGLVAEISAAAGLEPGEVGTGVDGCGVVAFALPLAAAAHMFSRLVRGDLDGSEAVAGAMRAHPELIGGPDSVDTRLMRALPGAVAKRGAEGVLGVGLPDWRGLALKVEDGSSRALGPVVRQLTGTGDPFAPVWSSRGEEVGRIVLNGTQSALALFHRSS
jgi:L-asparaginase II